MFFGCTHYPLIEGEIKLALGDEIKFFNGAPNLAKHLEDVLKERNLLEDQGGKIEFIDTNNSIEKKERFYKVLGVD